MAVILERTVEIHNALLDNISRPLGLTKLSPHFSLVIYSTLFFTLAQHVIVPVVSKRLAPQTYGSIKGRAARNKWAIRGVSMIHALLILPLAFRAMSLPPLIADRAFGWDECAGTASAVTTGYFLWDSLDSIFSFDSIGFVIHGLSCLMIYLHSFRPFLAYYALRCLFWETSTLFLNIHWFLDKVGQTGSSIQAVNAVLLFVTFFGFRIVWGGIISYQFFNTLFEVQDQIPRLLFFAYGVGNILLQGLNWYWLFAMVRGFGKRFNREGLVTKGTAGMGNKEHGGKAD